jgi:hypothetical protein
MGLREQVRDPWTYLLGALAGGVAWAVGLPAAAILGVGAAVSAAKAATGAALGESTTSALPIPPRPLPSREGTPEAVWLERAEQAVAAFDRLARSIPNQILSERSRSMGEGAAQTLAGLRRLAGQASTTRAVSNEMDEQAMAAEAERLERQRDRETDLEIRTEMTHSLESVRDQVEVARRLRRSLAQLLARIESGALGLEGLEAQLAEILAMSDAGEPDQGAAGLNQLTDELEGLRAGMAETERLSRRALSASGREGTVAGEPPPPRANRPQTEGPDTNRPDPNRKG